MKLDKYELKSGEQLEVFEFVSIGQKGKIPKIVQYTPTNYKDLYNLGFGDKNIETGEIDDSVISNNGDSEKVLATLSRLCMHSLISTKKQWYMQLEVQNPGFDYIEWGLQNISMRLKKISKFMESLKMDGKNFEKMLNMKHFL